MKGIRSATELNAAAAAIAGRGKAGRASSTAPPSPPVKPKDGGSAKPVKSKAPPTKVPEPAKNSGPVDTGKPTPATATIVHNHYYK